MTWLTLVLAAGTALRVTRLITKDTIFDGLRLWVINRIPRGWWLKLWTCPPCMSVWVAFLVVAPVALLFGDTLWFQYPALALTLSQVVVLVAVSVDND